MQSIKGGTGITCRATSAIRLNLSVALVRTLHDAIRVVQGVNEAAKDEVYKTY